MSTPSDHDAGPPSEPGDARPDAGATPAADVPFDPYRFGKPEHPVPAEYAPPGYVPDPEPSAPPTGGAYPPPAAPGQPYGAPSPGYYGQPPQNQPPYGQQPYGQAPYGQAPYGAPPYPPAPYGPDGRRGYGAPTGGNGKAVTALVLGILSIVLCFLTFLDAVLIIPAIAFGSIALRDARRGTGGGRGMAIAGIVCAAIGAVLAISALVLVTNAYNSCGGANSVDDSNFTQCVQDNLFK